MIKKFVPIILFFVLTVVTVIMAGKYYILYNQQKRMEIELEVVTKKLEDMNSLVITTTVTGMKKKGDIYLITEAQELYRLACMVEKGEEIEPGILAAEGAYRLTSDLKLTTYYDWLTIGRSNQTFTGTFDGDGHAIEGVFPTLNSEGEECLFPISNSKMVIKNLSVKNRMFGRPTNEKIILRIETQEDLQYVIPNLRKFSNYNVCIEINSQKLDVSELLKIVEEYWEQKNRNIQMEIIWNTEEEDKENSSLRYLKLEKIGELFCFTKQQSFNKDTYEILLDGTWEGQKVDKQWLEIPFTEMSDNRLSPDIFQISMEDINFDGKQDLLILEGTSGGSGGSWRNYRGIIWDNQNSCFTFFPSFPQQLHYLDFEGQRMISRARLGASSENVIVYEIVEGEYQVTRELILEYIMSKEGTGLTQELSYYEFGKLIQKRQITGGSDEAGILYPDMDFWLKG